MTEARRNPRNRIGPIADCDLMACPHRKAACRQPAQLSSESDRSTNDRFQENQNPHGLTGIGAKAACRLSTIAVVHPKRYLCLVACYRSLRWREGQNLRPGC